MGFNSGFKGLNKYSDLHSFCSLPYDRSIPSDKANPLHSAIYCFLFQFLVSCVFLKVVQHVAFMSVFGHTHTIHKSSLMMFYFFLVLPKSQFSSSNHLVTISSIICSLLQAPCDIAAAGLFVCTVIIQL